MSEIRKDSVVNQYHGWQVADPFRWLENGSDDETLAWVAAQNQATEAFVVGAKREAFRSRLETLWNYTKVGVPQEVGGQYFYLRSDGLQNQPILYRQAGLTGEAVVVINPNQLRADGTAALTNVSFTADGALVAYAIAKSGSDWQEIRIRDVMSGEDYPEVIDWCKFTGISWTKDGAGFFYSRFPEVEEAARYAQLNRDHRIYYHRVGTSQDEDVLWYARSDAAELNFHAEVSDDGVYLYVVSTSGTSPKTMVHVMEIAAGAEQTAIPLVDEFDAMYRPIGNMGSVVYLRTDNHAPRGRVIAVDIEQPALTAWSEVVAQQPEDVIASVHWIHQQFVGVYLQDAHHVIRVFGQDGQQVGEVALPGIGSVDAVFGHPTGSEMFFSFTSYLSPMQVFRYDFESQDTTSFYEVTTAFDATDYCTNQVFYESKDGTKVPMFLTHRKDLKLDGANKTMLYGYGGFSVNLTPAFSVVNLAWLEQGGIYAVANLRGGNEYGEAWHQEGMLHHKQNVFDDFIAAGEWLVRSGHTAPSKLAIMGASNGGLLVAVCMLQRPDLFGAVVSRVPVTDMLRYHLFTAGRYWVPEYGNAELSAADFRAMYAYSPLHNVRLGAIYPPVLITTAETDDRVVPLHAKKFAATLQDAAVPAGPPVLLRVETGAGHGAGKPTSKVIAENADIYAFVMRVLGM